MQRVLVSPQIFKTSCLYMNFFRKRSDTKLYSYCVKKFKLWHGQSLPSIFIRHKATFSPKADNNLLKLIRITGTEKHRLSGAVLLLLISSSVTMAVPYCLGQILDMFKQPLPRDELVSNLSVFCKIIIVVLVIGAIANFGRVYLINLSNYRITNSLRKKVYYSILDQEIAFFDKTRTGELIHRLTSDTSIVGASVTSNISDGLRSCFSFLAASALMIYTCPYLAFVGLITVSPVAIVAIFYGRYLKKITKSVQDSFAEATEVAEERISHIRTVHAFAKQHAEKELYFSKVNNMLNFAAKESFARAVFFGMSGFSGNLIALSVLYSGGFMMAENAITVGSLSSFILYAAYVGISIGGMSTFYAELMRGWGASTRLFELIERQSPLFSSGGGIKLREFHGGVEFNKVNFSYPSRPDTNILRDFSLVISSNSIFALVGPSGSGKSTLASLLLRFYDSEKGSIKIDGIDIKTLHVDWLRENIGLVSQEPILFSCSIKENIVYGAKELENSDWEKSAAEANVTEFVQKFPLGFETVVGEKGVLLSGGQRQRIAIARALFKNPKILILDEATSALDSESEYLVQGALEKLMVGRTSIIIAHRLSTIRKAHRIAVMNNGLIVEEGGYEELFDRRGLFYRLVKHQTIES